MKRVRFAPSPTGSLHVGNALSAVANRGLGDWMLLRIDDTDPQRNVPGGEEEIIRDLEWLGLDLGRRPGPPERAAGALPRGRARSWASVSTESRCCARTAPRRTTSRASSTTSDFGITHIVRGFDHRPNEELHRRLFQALGATPPEFVHHGLILGEDGKKLAEARAGRDRRIAARGGHPRRSGAPLPRGARHPAARRALRPAPHPAARDRGDRGDGRRGARTRRPSAPVEVVPALRGARDLNEAREYAEAILTAPQPVKVDAAETLERFRELVERTNGTLDARALVRELKAVGGNLKALRLALTGQERGPELWAVIAALPRDEALRRIDAAL